MNIEETIRQLEKEILYHQQLYYVKSLPVISDENFDWKYDKLVALEKEHPYFKSVNSPTTRAGSDLTNSLSKEFHKIPVLSLEKCNTVEGLMKWIRKEDPEIELQYIIESKFDGASIVLYYEKGKLVRALTRGDGKIGNDVTHNVRTIKTIPLVLNEKIDLIVRGEIFIRKDKFKQYNESEDSKYANPRNLASGSLRNLKSSITAKVPLDFYAYDGHFPDEFVTDLQAKRKMKELGFPVDKHHILFNNNVTEKKIQESLDIWKNLREKFDYEIDGLVIKILNLKKREDLGYSDHHPKWAIAFKFEPPLGQTILKDITFQIGRAGKVTPVAELEPVELNGSTIGRATLHNEDYINSLGVNIGDVIEISKRGDIIPAVERVIEKRNVDDFSFINVCPSCGDKLVKIDALWYCMGNRCPEKLIKQVSFFCSKGCMDIDSVSESTIRFLFKECYIPRGIVSLYNLLDEELIKEEGFGKIRVDKIKKNIEESKNQPYEKVFPSLGLHNIGSKLCLTLIKKFKMHMNLIETCQKIHKNGYDDLSVFTDIDGIAEGTARNIVEQISHSDHTTMYFKLRSIGLNFESTVDYESHNDGPFKDQLWVITGSFEEFKPRSKAAKIIEENGGKTSGGVTGKTTHLLAGPGAGSKLKKAKDLNVEILNEEQFLLLLEKYEIKG